MLIIGLLAATLTTTAFLPQMIKTWQTKSANDVSYAMLITFISGVFLWLIYGILTKDIPVILANAFTLVFNLAILYLKIKYGRNKEEEMAKLYFRFGAMGSSKTANALMTRYNFLEKGKRVLLVKPDLEIRDGQNIERRGGEASGEPGRVVIGNVGTDEEE